MFKENIFNAWYDLNQEIKKIDGVKEVLSNANAFDIVRNDSLQKFDFVPLVTKRPNSQAEVDSVKHKLANLPFYKGVISSEDGRAHIMFATFDQSKLNTKGRIAIVQDIKKKVADFGTKIGISISI